MNNYLYDRVKLVSAQDAENKYDFQYVTELNEYDHEIEITSATKIDGLNRGFIGDLYCHLRGTPITDDKKEVTTITGYRDVLLVRITVSARPGYAVEWQYTFFKD